MVQVFAQTGQSSEGQNLWDHEDMNGYQLLNEVGSGGTLSSLFTILSLFTEDVKMSWQDDLPDIADEFTDGDSDGPTPIRNRMRRANSDVSQFDLDAKTRGHARKSSVSSVSSSTSRASTVHASDILSPRAGSLSPGSFDEPSHPSISTAFTRAEPVLPVHRGVVARATEDTTLAVIPAEAFRRLTKNFPKATGHIVQGNILSWDLSACMLTTS
jgi:lysophospholipid hydrolase